MNLEQKVQLVIAAAREKRMSANEWTGNGETRVYLRRTNADRTEAGYIRFFDLDGKPRSKWVLTASGGGSRTCDSEGESVYRRYRELRKEAINTLNIWDQSDTELNGQAPAHAYRGANQFSAAYNPERRAFALALAEGKTPVHYQWDGDFDATENALKAAGEDFRHVCGVCWVDDFEVAKISVHSLPQTKEDAATLVKIEL